MLLGHVAVGLAGRRLTPDASFGAWILAVLFVDFVWPLFLLTGLERVRIVPGITAFTPLDFTHYPITHSLVAGVAWGALVALVLGVRGASRRTALLLGAGVLSHWWLDAIVHRPDLPVLPGGPYVGLGLWNSIAGTMALELTLFAVGLALYLQAFKPRRAFWVLIGFLVIAYLGAAFGPPPPNVTTLALTALAMWLLVPVAWWVDQPSESPPHP